MNISMNIEAKKNGIACVTRLGDEYETPSSKAISKAILKKSIHLLLTSRDLWDVWRVGNRSERLPDTKQAIELKNIHTHERGNTGNLGTRQGHIEKSAGRGRCRIRTKEKKGERREWERGRKAKKSDRFVVVSGRGGKQRQERDLAVVVWVSFCSRVEIRFPDTRTGIF